jgi:hypothetical protein
MRGGLRPTPRRIAVFLAATAGIGLGVAYAASLTVGSWHLWAGSQPLTKATCTLTGSAQTTDTYVNQASANSSAGSTATTLLVKSNTGSQEWTFIRFDVASCGIPATGGADTATLTFYTAAVPSSRTLTVAPVLATWSGSLTWTSAQLLTYGATTTTIATGSANNTAVSTLVTVDVDAFIKGSATNYGWRIIDSNTGNATTTFAATEYTITTSHRPQLVINYEK